MWATWSCRCDIFWVVAITNDQKNSRENQSGDRAQLLNLQRQYRELIMLRHQVKTVEAKATKEEPTQQAPLAVKLCQALFQLCGFSTDPFAQ
jgi:hypothetical protein